MVSFAADDRAKRNQRVKTPAVREALQGDWHLKGTRNTCDGDIFCSDIESQQFCVAGIEHRLADFLIELSDDNSNVEVVAINIDRKSLRTLKTFHDLVP